ncbi:MAG: response regulator [Spirochaetes bacterium]|nr:MAG: response regulator [Spirochaetota bacterium]
MAGFRSSGHTDSSIYDAPGIIHVSDKNAIYEFTDRWFFLPKDILEDKEPSLENGEWDMLSLYTSWENQGHEFYHGTSWYFKKLVIDEVGNYGLSLPFHYRGLQLYCNGQIIHETRPFEAGGINPEIVGKSEVVLLPVSFQKKGVNIVAIRTGILNGNSGFQRYVKFGPYKVLQREWFINFIWYCFLAAIDLFLFVYFLLYYNYRKGDLYYLVFSLLALSIGLFILGYKGIALWIFDSQQVYVLLTYGIGILIPPLLILFIHVFLKQSLFRITYIILSFYAFLLLFLFADCIYFSSPSNYIKYFYEPFIQSIGLVLVYGLWISFRSKRLGKAYSMRILTGMLVLAICSLLSMFHFLNVFIFTRDYTAEGFFFMVLVFASVLASRFAQVHTELESAHGELLVVDKMKDDFLATTSHELRTPLHGIIGLSEVMERDKKAPLPAKHRENVGLIKRSAERLAGLVNEILDFSKLQAGKVDLFIEEIRLPEHIAGLVSLAQGLVGEKPLRLTHAVPEDLPSIVGDKHRFEQIMLNLIGNAIKFTPEGEVEVSARTDNGGVLVSVRDTGPGIRKEDLNQIWSAYKQVEDPSTRHYEGAGLGLPITKRLVELHGGRVWADSTLGKGSVFHVWLPAQPPQGIAGVSRTQLARADILPPVMIEEPIPEVRVELREAGRHRPGYILAVDDDPVNLKIVADILGSEEYEVRTAASGPEAVEHVAREIPALVILDIMLPGMSGYEVAFRIRTDNPVRFIPIIMVSARAQLNDLVQGFIFGGNDYITKPYNAKELLVRVENQLAIGYIFQMEDRVKSHLSAKTTDLEISLLERTATLNEAITKMSDWEKLLMEDLNLARLFVGKMMMKRIDSQERLETAIHYDPLYTIGGDIYDIYEHAPGRIRILIIDATGHGVNASFNCISILTEYDLIRRTDLSPGEVFTFLNERLCSKFQHSRVYFTGSITDVDLNAGEVTASSAGHPEQYVHVPGKGVIHLKPHGAICGINRTLAFDESRADFPPGATLFLYTDGILENFSFAQRGEERRKPAIDDDKRLVQAFGENVECEDLEECLRNVLVRMKGTKYAKNRMSDDDITMVAMRRRT